MRQVLVAVVNSSASLCAVRHVIREYRKDPRIGVHLLNVRPRISNYVARHVRKQDREAWYEERAENALRPARELLEKSAVPCRVHMAKGEAAQAIVACAKDLRCDCIVIGTARQGALQRLLSSSVTNRVLALTDTPVQVVVGDEVSNLESIGISAGVGLGIAGLIMLVFD